MCEITITKAEVSTLGETVSGRLKCPKGAQATRDSGDPLRSKWQVWEQAWGSPGGGELISVVTLELLPAWK